MKVDFFIVGAPKAGTTSLYYYLKEHPEIEMSREKEPNYFSNKFIQNQDMYYGSQITNSEEKYHSLFTTKALSVKSPWWLETVKFESAIKVKIV